MSPATRAPTSCGTLTFAEANAWRDRFAAVPFEDKGGTWQGRYYQDIAIDAGAGGHRRRAATASC